MPYIESVCKAGMTIEVERYYTSRYGKRGQGRGEKVKPTPEEQKKINARIAEKKLRRLINENFSPGDYHLVLTYAKARGEPARDKDDMREDIAKFLRAMRKEYKDSGKEFKYIHVMEVGPKGARHHHLIINNIDTRQIQKCWPHGRINVNPLDQSGNYKDLASYLIKYTNKTVGTKEELQGKRWNCSRNLVHPKPTIKIITKRSWFRNEPKVPAKYAKDYYIDPNSIVRGIHSPEYGGYGFMRFTMVRLC